MASSVFMSGRLQGLFALLPVAGAELIRLQRIEHSQHVLGAAADGEVGHVDEADHTLGVDDVGGALGHAGLRVEDSECARELALDIREHRERQILQLLPVAPPGEMYVLAVDADAEQLRVAGAELLVELAEGGDLGGADEGEILGPEEHHLPLAGEALVGEGLERLRGIARYDAGEGEPGETLAYA